LNIELRLLCLCAKQLSNVGKSNGKMRGGLRWCWDSRNLPETHAPPGGTGPAARRQCRYSESVWLCGEFMIFGYFDIQCWGKIGFEEILRRIGNE